METIYRAFDGTIFETAWECEQYEKLKKIKGVCYVPFKVTFHCDLCDEKVTDVDVVAHNIDIESMPSTVDNFLDYMGIYVDNQKTIDYLNAETDYNYCMTPHQFHLWDTERDDWTTLDELITKYTAALDNLLQLKQKIDDFDMEKLYNSGE